MTIVVVPPFRIAGDTVGLRFKGAHLPGERYTIAAVGDILLHEFLQREAVQRGGFRFLWQRFIPWLQWADISYANLEGPLASGVDAEGRSLPDPGHVFDNVVYSSYPRFNYHPALAAELVRSGFDVVSTANNHALDRHGLGVDRTIDVLRRAGLHHTGTRKADEAGQSEAWCAQVHCRGLRTVWIGCTYGVNEVPDPRGQVLHGFEQIETIKRLVSAWKERADAVFVTPHFGEEYQWQPEPEQRAFAREMLECGAVAVIGNHPHVVQPMEVYHTQDGRETFIIHSLGNFVSGQSQIACRSTVILLLGVTKTSRSVHLNGVSFLPAFMNNDPVPGNVPELRPIVAGHPGAEEGLEHILRALPRDHMLYCARS